MNVTYGFTATMTALPGRGDDLVALLLTGLDAGSPAASEHCVVYLLSRSAANPDVVQVTEGWTTEDDHHKLFAGETAQAMVARIAPLLAGDSTYTDLTPVNGKATF